MNLHRTSGRSGVDDERYDPAPTLLLRTLFAVAILLAIAIVDVHLGVRVAALIVAFAAVAITTRLPRILPITVTAMLLIAVAAVLASRTPMPTHLPPTPKVANHAHRRPGNAVENNPFDS